MQSVSSHRAYPRKMCAGRGRGPSVLWAADARVPPPSHGAHPMDLEPVRVDRAAGAVQEGQGIGTDGSAAISPSAQMD